VTLERVCVYAGSNVGARPSYREAAVGLAHTLVTAGIGIVYGGGAVGLMGALADAALDLGGAVTGVIPRTLLGREVAHAGLADLRVVASMHERKALMADLADAFVALPGGYGTLEELVEVLTWTQLGLHRKPCAVLNVDGYYDGLLAFLDHAVGERFLAARDRELLVVAERPPQLLARLREFEAPRATKWLDRDTR
jgi:uncharacterized protein (TIGR00730 family)